MDQSEFKVYSGVLFVLLVASISMIGCAPSKYVASTNQESGIAKVYQEGIELLISEKPKSIVAAGVKRYEKDQQHMQLILIIENKGGQSFNVLPTSIMMVHEKEGKSKKIDIYPPEEAVEKITFNERLIAALSIASASYNQNTDVNTNLDLYNAHASSLQAAVKGNHVNETLLRDNTLFGGDSIFGVVYFSLKKDGKLRVAVPAGDETHVFKFVSKD